MAQKHFTFRLSDKTGQVVLRALEGAFERAQTADEQREIALVSSRLRGTLERVDSGTREGG